MIDVITMTEQYQLAIVMIRQKAVYVKLAMVRVDWAPTRYRGENNFGKTLGPLSPAPLSYTG